MKTLYVCMFLLLSACGQQLVDFGSPRNDMNTSCGAGVLDKVCHTTDLSMMSPMDLSPSDMPMDLSPDLSSQPDMATILPNPLAACADMFGTAAQSFAVLGGSTVTNTGSTTDIVGGNIGVSPGSEITGIPSGMPIGGSIHAADSLAAAAQVDVTNTYTCEQATACEHELTGQDLGGMRLTPGVYCFTSSAALNGTLVLDANGDPNATWFFQIASTLTVADLSHIHVIGGGQACKVFWQVGSSATFGISSSVTGIFLSMASITLNTGASVLGRVFARSGAVTMDSNDIVVPTCM